ncbi:MAG: DoxX family protein [Planctomycetota bacterium]|nr:MAG: DoxX family protein [Planctomycetota bacterium]
MLGSLMHSGLPQQIAMLLMRVWFGGAMFLAHGWSKIGRNPSEFHDPLGIGLELSLYLVIFAEVFCALLIVVGLATRLATIPLMITMAVAGLLVHPVHTGAMSYFTAYLVLLILGPGKCSLDYLVWRSPAQN